MNCEQYDELLQQDVDGVLSAADRARLDEHYRTCSNCRELLRDLKEIRGAAASLDRHLPGRGVWEAIAAKTTVAPPKRSAWMPFAAAAMLTMLIGSAVFFDLERPRPVDQSAETLARSAASELQLAEQHYVNAISALEQLTANKQNTLDPAVAGEIAQSLGTIDRAIGESRAALKTDPNSLVAQTSLLEALRMKVALLQETVSLIGTAERQSSGTPPKL